MALKKNLVANYIGQGWVALMGIAFVPIYIKLLGIESYALIGIFASMQAMLGLLDIGIGPTLNREMARYQAGTMSSLSIRNLLRTLELISCIIASLVAITVCLASDWLATSWTKSKLLDTQTISHAFCVMGCVCGLRFVESVYRNSVIGLQRQVAFNIINCIAATVRAGGAALILVWISPSIKFFFVWQGLISMASVFVLGLVTYGALPKVIQRSEFSLSELGRIWGYARGIVLISILALVLTQIDKVLLSRILTLHEYGQYALAGVVAGSIYIFVAPITQAIFPKLSILVESKDFLGLESIFRLGAQLASILLGGVCSVLIICSEQIIIVWTQDLKLAHEVGPLLSVLTTGNMLHAVMWMPYHAQLAHGLTSLSIKLNIVVVAIFIPALVLLVPTTGSLGAAWIWVGVNSIYCTIGVYMMFRRILLGLQKKWLLHDTLLPLATSFSTVYSLALLIPISQNRILAVITIISYIIIGCLISSLVASEIRPRYTKLWSKFINGTT